MIIFGGIESGSPDDSLYELDLINYVWRIPNTSGKIPQASRTHHSANIIGKYVVISFGKYHIFRLSFKIT